MSQYRDVVIDSRIVPIFEGTPSAVRYWLSVTQEDKTRLRVRAGKMQKIVTAEEYLKEKVSGKSRREKIKDLLTELVKEVDLLGRQHDYPFDKLEALPEEYTKKFLQILNKPGVDRSDEEEK